MIYNYEACMLKYFNAAVPSVKSLTFGTKEDIYKAIQNIQYYPSLYATRNEEDWTFPQVWGVDNTKFNAIEQSYRAIFCVENQLQAIDLSRVLRMYTHQHPYIEVPFNDETLKVGNRYSAIKISEDRNLLDLKGLRRFVEVSWVTHIFLSDSKEEYKHPTVDKVSVVFRANSNSSEPFLTYTIQDE